MPIAAHVPQPQPQPRHARRLSAVGAWLLGLLLILGPAGPARGQEPAGGPAGEQAVRQARVTDPVERALQAKLMAPCCWNGTIDNHESGVTASMKREIHERLARGESEEQILAHFVSVYGTQVLAQPPARGFNLLVYVLPVLAFLAGMLVLARFLRRQTAQGALLREAEAAFAGAGAAGGDGRAAAAAKAATAVDAAADPYEQRVERALQRLGP